MRYFVAVADEPSMTKATGSLRLAQPSLTRQIRNLEEELHVTLFHRTKKRLELTESGHFFLKRARQLLTQAEANVHDLRSHNKGEAGPLKIGYMLDMQYDLLPVTLAAFRKVWPRVALNLMEMTASEQIAALRKNKTQVGFAREPGLPSLTGLQSEVLTKCKMMAVLPDTYPLKKRTPLRLGDLAGQAFISLSEDDYPGTSEWLNRVCREAGFTPNITHESNSACTLIHLVALEMGVALLPESCLRLPHEGGGVPPAGGDRLQQNASALAQGAFLRAVAALHRHRQRLLRGQARPPGQRFAVVPPGQKTWRNTAPSRNWRHERRLFIARGYEQRTREVLARYLCACHREGVRRCS